MPRITIHLGGRERPEPTITKATPMGALGTEAIVRLGPASITGSAPAVRALADALVEAAELAEAQAIVAAWDDPDSPQGGLGDCSGCVANVNRLRALVNQATQPASRADGPR